MSDNFVPLPSPGSGSRGDTSFATIRATPSVAKSATAAGGACGKPVVTLQRSGDTVTAIRVQCSCGQIIELACVYTDVPPSANPAVLSQN
jgi:hypothetical protein